MSFWGCDGDLARQKGNLQLVFEADKRKNLQDETVAFTAVIVFPYTSPAVTPASGPQGRSDGA